jgi:hypothetical protein
MNHKPHEREGGRLGASLGGARREASPWGAALRLGSRSSRHHVARSRSSSGRTVLAFAVAWRHPGRLPRSSDVAGRDPHPKVVTSRGERGASAFGAQQKITLKRRLSSYAAWQETSPAQSGRRKPGAPSRERPRRWRTAEIARSCRALYALHAAGPDRRGAGASHFGKVTSDCAFDANRHVIARIGGTSADPRRRSRRRCRMEPSLRGIRRCL